MSTPMKGRGTVFKFPVSSTLTAVPGIETITLTGQGTRTTEVITLDAGVGVVHWPDGFANVTKIALKMLFDITNAVHLALLAASETPGTNSASITYTDAGPVTKTYSVTGVNFDVSVEGSKPVECTVTLQTSGLPS